MKRYTMMFIGWFLVLMFLGWLGWLVAGTVAVVYYAFYKWLLSHNYL